TMADIIIKLTNLGAVAIGFDVMYSEPDRLNPDVAARTMRYLDEATRARLRELPSNDQILADAIRSSRVVLGATGLGEARSEPDESLPLTGVATLGGDVDPLQLVFQFPGLLRNVPVLEKAAAGRGLLTIVPERDGIIRRVPMVLKAQGNAMASLSLEILRVVSDTPTILIKSNKAGIESIKRRGPEIPTDNHAQLWGDFARQDRKRDIYGSAADVIANKVPVDKIKGKLVLIGTSAVGLNDIKTTPVSPAMPGVEIHAQILESTLTGGVVSRPSTATTWEFLAAMMAGLFVIIFAPNMGPTRLVRVGALV